MKQKETQNSQRTRFIIYTVTLNLLISVFILVWIFNGTDSNKIVYVDAIKLLGGYKGMELAKKEYDVKVSGWNSNLDTLKMEMDATFKEYEARKRNLSPKDLGLMEETLETKRQQYLEYQQIVTEKLKNEDQELTKKVYSKINEYLKKHGKQNGYAFILSANQYGSIAYAEDGIDITNEVLEGLNAELGK